METIILKTNLSCPHCVKKVEPLLKGDSTIVDYKIDLDHRDKLVTITANGTNLKSLVKGFKNAGYTAERL